MAKRIAPMIGDPGVTTVDAAKHMMWHFVTSPFQFVNPYFYTRIYFGDVSRAELVEHLSYSVVWAGAVSAAAYHSGQVISPLSAYSLGSRIFIETAGVALVPFLLATPMMAGYAANVQLAKSMPQHSRPSFWRSVSQALTGTGPGVGSWTP